MLVLLNRILTHQQTHELMQSTTYVYGRNIKPVEFNEISADTIFEIKEIGGCLI